MYEDPGKRIYQTESASYWIQPQRPNSTRVASLIFVIILRFGLIQETGSEDLSSGSRKQSGAGTYWKSYSSLFRQLSLHLSRPRLVRLSEKQLSVSKKILCLLKRPHNEYGLGQDVNVWVSLRTPTFVGHILSPWHSAMAVENLARYSCEFLILWTG